MSDRLNVGVLFRNNEKLVNPFLFFLRKSLRDIKVSVIAVDQDSDDNTHDELSYNLDHDVDALLKPEKNLGIAQGRNFILDYVKRTHGGYTDLLLMDSDTFIMQRLSIENLVNDLKARDDCGIAYGLIRSWYDFPTVNRGISFCLIKKETFERVGDFDPNFWMFWDDTDFMDRMELKGLRHLPCNKAHAMHMWGQTTNFGSEAGEIRKAAIAHDKDYFESKWPGKKLPDVT